MAIQRQIVLPSGAVFPAGYEWLAGLSADFFNKVGGITLYGHNSAANAAAGLPPDVQYQIQFGQVETDGQGRPVTFPTIEQFLADNKAAFDSLKAYLYAKAAGMPSQAGAAIV